MPRAPSQPLALAQCEQQPDRQREHDEREDVQPERPDEFVAGGGDDAGERDLREQVEQQRRCEDDEDGAHDLGAQYATHD